MSAQNTLNVCLGHLPFPQTHERHIDLMIAPRLIAGPTRLALVDDSSFGPHGSALSEYVQLLWLLERLDGIAAGCEYVRIFHYRRFVSPESPPVGQASSNLPWATTIRAEDLDAFASAFSRTCTTELFNTPVQFHGGMLFQYAQSHVLEDMLNFAKFLLEKDILGALDIAEFLAAQIHIPSCNIGTFRIESYKAIFGTLRRAAEFLDSPYFVPRPGYQRRSVGFLLERLNSFLIVKRIQSGASPSSFGHNLVMSDGLVVSGTQ
jgi:hypothetical protein